MTRCPNCYNSITPDTQSCPSCAYLLIQSEKTPISQLAAAAPVQVRSSGRLQTSEQVRSSGRLGPADLAEPSTEERQLLVNEVQHPAYNGTRSNGARRRPGAPPRRSQKDARVAEDEQVKRRKKILIPLLVIGLSAAVVLLAPAAQMIIPQVDAQTSIYTLTTFRSQSSKQPGKTVDQCVNEWLEESRKSGDLVSYSGWSIKPIRFDKSKILLGFSFQEKDGVRMAEWLADVDNKTFTPKNDLADQVY